MRNLTHELGELYANNEEFRRQLGEYERSLKTVQGKVIKDVLLLIKGHMALDVFSYKYTHTDASEKDAQQRAYYYLNDILEFLMTPKQWVESKRKFQQSESRLKAQMRKELQHGR